ncbi:MAG: HDOD domain-containing protein [Phycisphaerae bacterium]|nr:HDOD domain-containing protein [Phycisphaerae bacterium]
MTSNMPNNTFDHTAKRKMEIVVHKIDSLQPLSVVSSSLLAKLCTGNAAQILSQACQCDPILLANTLLIAKKAGLPPQNQINCGELIEKIGTEKLLDILFSDNAAQPSQTQLPLMLHSIAVAIAAEAIAEKLAENSDFSIDPGQAWYAGLLHDIAKFVFAQHMPKSSEAITAQAESQQVNSCVVESQYLGMDHALVGKKIAQKWSFGSLITNAIWLHHSPIEKIEAVVSKNTCGMAGILSLADKIARQAKLGNSGSFDPAIIEPQLLDFLGLSADQTDAVRDIIEEKLSEITLFLGVAASYSTEDRLAGLQKGIKNMLKNKAMLRGSGSANVTDRFCAELVGTASASEGIIETATKIAKLWQRHFQGTQVKICIYWTSGDNIEAVALNRDGEDVVSIDYSGEENIPAGQVYIGQWDSSMSWLMGQVRSEFDPARTKVIRFGLNNGGEGGIIFETYQPLPAGQAESIFGEPARAVAKIMDLVTNAKTGETLAEEMLSYKQEKKEPVGQSYHSGDLVDDDERAALTEISEEEEEEEEVDEMLVEPQPPKKESDGDGDYTIALAEMAAGAAHELNNPLSVITGRSQLLSESEDDEQKKKDLRTISENARQISRIIDELMSFARPQIPKPHVSELKAIIEDAVSLAAQKTGTGHVNTQISISQSAEQVYVDSAQISSALANIIANSIESYKSDMGPVKITAERAWDEVAIRISDLGCGMNAQTIEKATYPFYSAKPAGRKRGMGLAYASRMVQLNEGKLRIESEEGKGTTVTIKLPADTTEKA